VRILGVRVRFLHGASYLLTVGVLLLPSLNQPAAIFDTSSDQAIKPDVSHSKPKVLAAATVSPTPTPLSASASKKSITRNSSVAGTGRQAFGIAGNMASLSPAALNARLDGIKALGATWVRYDIEWSNIENGGPGQYQWGDYDRVVAAVQMHGLQSLAIIDYSPPWARRSDCADSSMCAPSDPSTFAHFAGIVANRYRAYGVHYFEIWNEPNNVQFYRPAADPYGYSAMLRLAYASIKQANPSAFVITAGTAPADTGGGSMSPPDFVRGIYAAGARGSFDALAHHPYTWPYSPLWSNPDGAWGQLITLHNIMSNAGDGLKKIWITEYGAPTGGPGEIAASGFLTAEGHADHVTEALQARILNDAISTEMSLPWVGPFFWYSYQDAGTTSNTVENFFGLLRADGSPKPAYTVFQTLAHRY
jgi:hypothetical protein